MLFKNFSSAKNYILNEIPIDATVGIGHSATLAHIGMTNELIRRGNIVFDKELAKTREEMDEIKTSALLSDYYISSANSISIKGEIVNIDHSGNRVAAISYGPKKVYIVIGKNKIENSLEEAIARAKNIAAPKNAKRAGYNPPCVRLGECIDCYSEERVCNILSIIEGQNVKERMELLIVNEEAGF